MKDNEIAGTGNSLDFGARMYNPRLGKWLSLDPLQAKYPNLTPYNFVTNNPIIFVDNDGREAKIPKVIDRAPILKMLNEKLIGIAVLATHKDGTIYIQNLGENKENKNTYYFDKLRLVMEDEDVLELSKSQIPHDHIDPKNALLDKDINKEFGGGVTERDYKVEVACEGEGQDEHVKYTVRTVVTKDGNSDPRVKDTEGKQYKSSPSDILRHEIVGHAAPIMGHPDTGNAIENENKAKDKNEPNREVVPHSEQ